MDLIFVHTVQLKPMIKAQISRSMVSSAKSEVAFVSAYSEKTHLKKLMMRIMIIITSNKKKQVLVNGKKICRMAMHFSKKYGNKG